jgi:uncharacterized protein (UPF0332 family)
MKDFIKKYKNKGLIREENIGINQVIKHLERAKKDLQAANATFKIDIEVSYDCAYKAMLRSGRALMFSFKYRPIDGEQHKTVVAFSEYVLGPEYLKIVKHFDRMRKKRNRFTYDEPELLISETETRQALENAKKFFEEVCKFIQDKNPQKKLL